LGRNEQRWFDLYEPLLGLIAVAQGEGLTKQQLTAIIGKDTRAELRASKQYFTGELPNGPFRPFHRSFADFLLEDERNIDYHIDACAMHKRIAEYYWLKNHTDWTSADDYALTYLPTHLGMMCAWSQLEELLLDPIFIRTLSDLSHQALAEAYRWAHKCREEMPEGPRRRLLLRLSTVVEKLRFIASRTAEMGMIESFLESNDRQHLVVVGPPGIGKSSLAALAWVRHLDRCLLAKLEPLDSLITGIARAVSESSFLEARDLHEKLGRLGPSLLSEDFFDIVLRWNWNKNVCFIIDELDAARNVATELDRFPMVLPPGIQIIWVSRSIPELGRLMGAASVLDLLGMNSSQIADYCRWRLGEGIREDLVQRIAAMSDGNPLYINLVADELKRGVLRGRELETALPQSLSELYSAHVLDLEDRYPKIRERITALVDAITRREEPRVRLKDIDIEFNDLELDALGASGLFSVEHMSEGTTVTLFHASVLDFLRQRYGLA
jgi:hypothetical protein